MHFIINIPKLTKSST